MIKYLFFCNFIKYLALLLKHVFVVFQSKKVMNFPKCNNSVKVKSGKIKGRQRYTCKECGYNYNVELKSTAKPKSVKRQTLHMYLEGLWCRAIGRVLGVSNMSVLKWIRKFGQKAQELNWENQQIEMVEVDEMHSYIGSKKTVLDMDCCW